MQYRKVSITRKGAVLLLFSCSIFSSAALLASDGDEITQELTTQCESLARNMARINKKFPQGDIKKIEGLVTWHAALCGERPKGNGTVTALCDGHLASGKNIFFWQMRTNVGKLKNGFLTCE